MAGSRTSDAVLEASGLHKRYGSRVALADVSLEARQGELVACVGPNGAGKTTLLTILADIRRPDEGTVRRPNGAIGWVPQQPAVYSKLSAAENLRLFARLGGVADVDGAVQRMLEQTGLTDRADEPVERLSGGNRQRINIAIGVLASPSVLLLDEPSSALDPRQRDRLWSFITELASDGTAVVYSTHHVGEAERYAHRLLVLADGERLFWGRPDDLRAEAGSDGEGGRDFEADFVAFVRQRGH